MPYWFDGNNLIGLSAARARVDRETRRAFLASLSGYARLRGGRFVVFFDGDDPDRFIPPPGVQVRYSAPASTDDVIVTGLKEASVPAEIIVVTNDHSLRAGCRAAGAKTLDWSEFLARMKPRFQARKPGSEKEGPVDVEEWRQFFGLDKESLE